MEKRVKPFVKPKKGVGDFEVCVKDISQTRMTEEDRNG
jgi:hypothetical protein